MANFLSKFLGGGKGNNPANAAMPYLNQITPMAQQRLNPYIEQGQNAGNQAFDRYSAFAQNPADEYAKFQASYRPSSGYDSKFKRILGQVENAAAAGGFRGTPKDQSAQAQLVHDLLAEDEGNYISNLLGIQGMGLQGLENTANRGYGANQDLTGIMGNTLGSQATLAYKGQESKMAQRNGLFNILSQLAGGALGAYMGGPAGAAAGASMGDRLGGGGPDFRANDPYTFFQLGKGLRYGS